ncbi:TlyA family RNA methyltransferase [Gilvimarinus sp. SDUM040013]|uniref:TlyA family RNA methyltransferase n=1 Tax=Gilvimarinus gilvus TaxID=3058038 RepID=A0ABU4RVM1_9GAMM|nr:TlyA family RNA methyltransferase [Gilvimarinus sp. SDUM040013]MDO3387657.1 TlyA family RNA methyltransferase [Gilvimarinus sp. SDUM040013]MDX6848902.1 TlyA family RNA methyltransferase [Gilvimarinus sp. SDUM040013]
MIRLDQLLVERGLARSRAHAQKLIKAGCVVASEDAKTLNKPSLKVSEQTDLHVSAIDEDRYVSRGGLKLEGALSHTGFKLGDKIALDVGQSTGGFTDCLLQAGVKQVIGVDVGRDQLAEAIRSDARVTFYEGINARSLPASLSTDHTRAGFDIAVMDVSFISQTLILPALAPLLAEGGDLLSLVKPQFEVGRDGIGKGGIVRDPALYEDVRRTIESCCQHNGLQVHDYFASSIAGGDGNQEFFVWARKVQ